MIFALLFSCVADEAPRPAEDSAPEAPAAEVYAPLEPHRLARRISIDLRGRLPTAAELAIADTPGGLDTLTEAWLAEPAFEDHLADVVAEGWMLRLDTLRLDAQEFGLAPWENYDYTRAFGSEPAHLVAHVVAQDRPFTDIVTADFTMANELLTILAPVEFVDPEAPGEWKEARYTDGRPPNGVLATSGLWLRYHTTIFNYNRGRAAALARLLLCYDFAGRPVMFENVADESTEGLQEAISTSPGCIACHATMDPLAASLFGFWPYEDRDRTEMVNYHPEREMLSTSITGVAPGYFGTEITAAAQLGPLVAGDPRFAVCASRRAAERLWGRPTSMDDDPAVYALRDELTTAWSYKDLLRAVLRTPEYRAGALLDTASEADRERARPMRLLSPNTLAAVVEDATGFRWTLEGADLMDSDLTGYRVLLGGADGDSVREASLEPTVSRSVVLRRLTQAAATTVVEADAAADPAERRLFGTTTSDDPLLLTPGTDSFAAELTALHVRLLAQTPDADTLAALSQLYTDAAVGGGPLGGWTAVVSVLLRDPEFWTY